MDLAFMIDVSESIIRLDLAALKTLISKIIWQFVKTADGMTFVITPSRSTENENENYDIVSLVRNEVKECFGLCFIVAFWLCSGL